MKINGLSIISHVFKKAEKANIGEVIVATEDHEIVDDVKKNGGKAILTSNKHKTGTDRIYEAYQKLNLDNIDLSNLMIAGGLSIEDIPALKDMGAWGVDLNSKLEIAPGIKDPKLIEQLGRYYE